MLKEMIETLFYGDEKIQNPLTLCITSRVSQITLIRVSEIFYFYSLIHISIYLINSTDSSILCWTLFFFIILPPTKYFFPHGPLIKRTVINRWQLSTSSHLKMEVILEKGHENTEVTGGNLITIKCFWEAQKEVLGLQNLKFGFFS
jgi:hypothetical protein